MTAEYDSIAEGYTKLEGLRPERVHLVDPSFLSLVGTIQGFDVLDLACGSGHFTRRLARLGARKVTGVDLSAEMIRIGKETDKNTPNIEYFVHDVKTMGTIGAFDLITATFLLHYAKTREELQTMCDTIAQNLKPGKRFLALNNNPPYAHRSYAHLGTIIEAQEPLEEGDEIKVTLNITGKEPVSFTTYFWSKDTYELSLHRAGLSNIRWTPFSVTDEGIKQYGQEFFKGFIEKPNIIMIDAVKE